VVMIGKMLMTDMARFAFAFLCIIVCFATAFHFLFKTSSIGDFIITLRDTFLMAVGQVDPAQFFDNVHTPWFTTLLMILYVIVVTVLLLNLLIATMGQTYSDSIEKATLIWLLERARITQSIFSEFSPSPRVNYFIMQVPQTDELLPSNIDPQSYTKRRYLLALESVEEDVMNFCQDDQAIYDQLGVTDDFTEGSLAPLKE